MISINYIGRQPSENICLGDRVRPNPKAGIREMRMAAGSVDLYEVAAESRVRRAVTAVKAHHYLRIRPYIRIQFNHSYRYIQHSSPSRIDRGFWSHVTRQGLGKDTRKGKIYSLANLNVVHFSTPLPATATHPSRLRPHCPQRKLASAEVISASARLHCCTQPTIAHQLVMEVKTHVCTQ